MNIFKKIMVTVIFVASNFAAFAFTQNNAAVGMAGMENNGTRVFVGITPNPNNCLYSGVYFVTPAELNMSLSVALSAKMAGKQVRVDYTQPGGANTECVGSGIYVEW